jgi:very-short-patch-repair endonuclease
MTKMRRKRRYYKGKRVSKGEKCIIDCLNRFKVKFEMQKTFPDCRGQNNKCPLRFDFFLVDYNILIEYDGEHHYAPINKGYRDKLVHESTKINDEIKNKYIAEKGIGLLRIPYWEYDKIAEILIEVICL